MFVKIFQEIINEQFIISYYDILINNLMLFHDLSTIILFYPNNKKTFLRGSQTRILGI